MEEGKSYRGVVNSYTQTNHFAPPSYQHRVEQAGTEQLFYCTIRLGQQSFSTTIPQKTNRDAELEAAKVACLQLKITRSSFKDHRQELARKMGHTGNGPALEDIVVSSIDEVHKSVTDEVMAVLFKSYLHHHSQEDQVSYPAYETQHAEENGLKGYTGTCTFKGTTYKSLGLMQTRKQAEHSASEICLRTLEYLPQVLQEDGYTIQKFKGGHSNAMTAVKKQNMNKSLTSVLQFVAGHLGMEMHHYRVKESDDSTSASLRYIGVCWFEGCVFQSEKSCNTIGAARQSATIAALKAIGVFHPEEACKSRLKLRFKKTRFYNPLSVKSTPLMLSPSQKVCWIHTHYDYNLSLNGDDMDEQKKKLIIEKTQNSPFLIAENENEDIFNSLLQMDPEICGIPLTKVTDLTVGEICTEYEDVYLVGNNKFSIKMYCPGKSIFCKDRGRKVAIIAGHKIRGLVCSYKLCVPASLVYIQATQCDDLIFPNPSLPCVRSCGAVLMMYDNEAGNEVHVLLKQPSIHQNFSFVAHSLASYLRRIISGRLPAELDIPGVTKDIKQWNVEEVTRLSEMSMDSMRELFTVFLKYDDRWNEIFVMELTSDLKRLKELCTDELTRRNQTNQKESIAPRPWMLPTTLFKHRLHSTGVHMEDSDLCVFRCVREEVGIKIKLSEIKTSSTINLPADNDSNPHRGDIERFYIWKKCKTITHDQEDNYYESLDENILLNGNKWVDDGAKRVLKANQKREKVKRKLEESGDTGGKVSKIEVDDENIDIQADDDVKKEQESDLQATVAVTESLTDRISYHDDCRWFVLEEAKKKCEMLQRISETPQFLSELQQLKLEADEFRYSQNNLTTTSVYDVATY